MNELAIFGGKPVRSTPFPQWPKPNDNIKDHLIKTFENEGWGVGSTAINRFNEKFAEFQDAKYCISTSSGTTAIWVALKAAGIKAGDEVIVPSYTFIATASAVMMANAVPVFVDVEADTFNMDPKMIESVITSKTKAIIPVHIAGNPANVDKILDVANKHNLLVIEDAAQAHGASWKGKKVGAIGLGGIFSFQTSKNMTAGEGGAIVTNDEEFANACFSYHNCGRVKGGQWYEHQHLGGNFRLPALAASMLEAQLDSIESDINLRHKNRLLIDNALKEIPGLTPIVLSNDVTMSANHIYLSRYHSQEFNGVPREVFFKAMQAEGVYTYRGYVPLYKENLFITNAEEYPWLAHKEYEKLHMPVTEKLCNEESVWLKQNHLLGTKKDTQDVIDAFVKVTTAIRKDPETFKRMKL